MPSGDTDGRERESEPDTDAKAVYESCHHVPAAVIGAEQVLAAGRRRCRYLVEIVDAGRRIRIEREQRPVAVLGELLADERVVPIGRRQEVAAEPGFRRICQNGNEPFALVARDQGPVVAEQFGQCRDRQQHDEHPQRRVAQTVALETRPRALVGRPRRTRAHGIRRVRRRIVRTEFRRRRAHLLAAVN